MSNESVYKVLTSDQWTELNDKGSFAGSSDDLRDGFIHLSAQQQVAGVIKRYFSKIRPLFIVELPGNTEGLKWEESTKKESFPHLYNRSLFKEDILSVLEKKTF